MQKLYFVFLHITFYLIINTLFPFHFNMNNDNTIKYQKQYWDDIFSMCILLLLYTLQGIPMGLCGSVPLILKEKGTSYDSLTLFSMVTLPFSLKLLWAPIVDTYYFKSMGRRKSWLIPVQLLCGIVMYYGGSEVNSWIDNDEIQKLTGYFITIYLMMATQDIAVDGWALTMLSRDSVEYASTCNAIGQSIGFFMANQGFIALSDPRWCNRFLGLDEGKYLVTLSEFMQFWGIVFVVSTIIIWIFKNENDNNNNNNNNIKDKDKEENSNSGEEDMTLAETYSTVIKIFQIPSIRVLVLILLTAKISFAPTDSSFIFKLQEYGMPKSDIATVSPILLIVSLILPAAMGPLVSSAPLDIYMIGLYCKLGTTILQWYIFQYASFVYRDDADHEPGFIFFTPLLISMVLDNISSMVVYNAQMGFFARISDPAVGGTYMTLLNTVANMGSKWPNASALWLVSRMTIYGSNDSDSNGILGIFSNYSSISFGINGNDSSNSSSNDNRVMLFDGYTVLTLLASIYAVIWLTVINPILQELKKKPHEDWLVTHNKGKGEKETKLDVKKMV